MARGKPLERKPMKRTRKPAPVQTPGLKSTDEELWRERRHALWVRSGGRCELGREDLAYTGMEAHHRKLRSQGGGHELSNLVALCPKCHHDRVHAHPLWARMQGWMVPGLGNYSPAEWAVILGDGRTVRLTDDGHYDTVFNQPEGDNR